MKLRLVFALCLALAAIPAVGQIVYSNGPINGTTDAWTINFGFAVSDTFSVNSIEGSSPVTGLSFGAWLFPFDTLRTAEVSITSSEFGGTTYTDQVVSFTQSGCISNQYGYSVCTESGTLVGVTLSNGNYWLNLQNAVTAVGQPIFWDENSGPSSASDNAAGTVPSEAFTLLGTSTGDTSGSGGTIPEPSNIMLLGSGVLGLGGLMRRRLL